MFLKSLKHLTCTFAEAKGASPTEVPPERRTSVKSKAAPKPPLPNPQVEVDDKDGISKRGHACICLHMYSF